MFLLLCQSGFSRGHRFFGTKGHAVDPETHFTKKYTNTEKRLTRKNTKTEKRLTRKKERKPARKIGDKPEVPRQGFREKFESQLEKLAINQKVRLG